MNDVPDALVEKFGRALNCGAPPNEVQRQIAGIGLAAVWPDLAEERRRAIESALTFAAAELEDADYVVRCDDPLHQDAADVRRALARRVEAFCDLREQQGHEYVRVDDVRAMVAREAGGRHE